MLELFKLIHLQTHEGVNLKFKIVSVEKTLIIFFQCIEFMFNTNNYCFHGLSLG